MVRMITLGAALFALAVQAHGAETPLPEKAKQWFKPLPQTAESAEFPTSAQRVALGRKLFFDPRLSLDGTVACATCHRPALYGTDALPKSIGAEHRLNARNAPTILNTALQFKAHWIGDRANVEEQAQRSLIGPASFGNPDYAAVVAKLKALPGYEASFRAAFPQDPDPVRPENLGAAIGAYERILMTPAPFDRYLKGEQDALSAAAQRGLTAFIDNGCASCHNGAGVGGGSFQKFGLVGDYWKATGSAQVDEGRFSATHEPADRYVFKVPSLRNVAMTPPYFHDGAVDALPEAVRIMARLQLGKTLTDAEIADITAFLDSLTGELPADFQAEPVLAPAAFRKLPEASTHAPQP